MEFDSSKSLLSMFLAATSKVKYLLLQLTKQFKFKLNRRRTTTLTYNKWCINRIINNRPYKHFPEP